MSNLFQHTKTKFIIALFSAVMLSTSATGTAAKGKEVELHTDVPVTKEEIATIHILGELCPKIIGANSNFNAGFKRLAEAYLPNISDPLLAFRALEKDPDYVKILRKARSDANNFSPKQSREACLGVIEFR